MKAGVEPGAGRDLSALRSVGSTGSPLAPEGFELDLRACRRRHLAVLDLRRHRRLHRLRRRRADPARLSRASFRARSLGAAVEAWDEDGNAGRRRGRRARDHRADALDADLLLGRRGRLALPRQLLRDVPGRLAPRRLDRDHLARHGDHLRALGLDHQPLRRSHGHRGDLPRGRRGSTRSSTRSSSTSRGPGTEGWMPLFVVLARGSRARRGARRGDRGGGSASGARRATCPTRSTRSPRCPARSAARCSRCR